MIDDARVDIFFVLQPSFMTDPYAEDGGTTVPLPIPKRRGADAYMLRSGDAVERPDSLLEHYREVFRLVDEHKLPYQEFELYLWLDLTIYWDRKRTLFGRSNKANGLAFIYNHFDRIAGLLDWISNAEDGAEFHDMDQSWEMLIIRRKDRYHFRWGGFDEFGEVANVALLRDPLLAAIERETDRVRSLLKILVDAFGEDYWSAYRLDLRTDL